MHDSASHVWLVTFCHRQQPSLTTEPLSKSRCALQVLRPGGLVAATVFGEQQQVAEVRESRWASPSLNAWPVPQQNMTVTLPDTLTWTVKRDTKRHPSYSPGLTLPNPSTSSEKDITLAV